MIIEGESKEREYKKRGKSMLTCLQSLAESNHFANFAKNTIVF